MTHSKLGGDEGNCLITPAQTAACDVELQDANSGAMPRRAFLLRALCAGGVVAGAAIVPGKAQADILDFLSRIYDFNPVVLNYAHEMEELQADFFQKAAISKACDALSSAQRNVIYGIAAQDKAHFDFLDELTRYYRTRNGGALRTQQASAGLRPKIFTFPGGVFSSPEMLLPFAVELKELCVSAYHGAVDLIGGQLLTPAAAIAGVEGRQLAVLREISGLDPVPFSFENQVSPQSIGSKLAKYGFEGGKTQEG